jgi:hypothetical protein
MLHASHSRLASLRSRADADEAASLAVAKRLQAEEDASASQRRGPQHALHPGPRRWQHAPNDGSLYDGVGFHLTRIAGRPGAPPPRNAGAVCFEDLLRPDATTGGIRCALLGGCGVVRHWLLAACPMLLEVPKVCVIFHEKNRKPPPGEKRRFGDWQPNFELVSPSLYI